MPEHTKTSAPQKTNKVSTSNQSKNIPIIKGSHPPAIIQRAKNYPESLTHADVMQLQRTIGNLAVMQLFKDISSAKSVQKNTPVQAKDEQSENNMNVVPDSNSPIQMKPDALKGFITPDLAPGKLDFSTWSYLASEVNKYSAIGEENIEGRTQAIGRMYELIVALSREFSTKRDSLLELGRVDEIDPKDTLRYEKAAKLNTLLQIEDNELKPKDGQIANPVVAPVSANPEITKQIKISDKAVLGGIFKENTDIANNRGKKTGQGSKGKACMIVKDWPKHEAAKLLNADTDIVDINGQQLQAVQALVSCKVVTGEWKDTQTVKSATHAKITKDDDGINAANIQDGFVLKDKLVSAIKVDVGTHKLITKEDQTKAGDNFENIPDGYVKPDNIIEVKSSEKNNDLKYDDRTDAKIYPLFPHYPQKADVVQVGLGDCYLLAAVVSVVDKKPKHFLDHMQDNKNGTVTVRLYDDVNKPRDITVSKNVVVKTDGGSDAFAAGALWVKILEKAYVVAGYVGAQDDVMPENTKRNYGMAEGGFGSVAFKHLLGVATEQSEIGKEDPETDKGVWYDNLKDTLKKDYITKQEKGWEDKAMKLEVLGSALRAEFTDNDDVRVDDIKKVMKAKGYKESSPEWQVIISKIATPGKEILSGALGSGAYTPREKALFDEIKLALDGGKVITVGTKEKVWDHKSGNIRKGQSAGEDMGKGLAGTHAYSVLDYAPKGLLAPNVAKALSVKLRNPWGKYGRKYKNWKGKVDVASGTPWSGEAAEDEDAGEFWIDISELFARFTHLDKTQAPI